MSGQRHHASMCTCGGTHDITMSILWQPIAQQSHSCIVLIELPVVDAGSRLLPAPAQTVSSHPHARFLSPGRTDASPTSTCLKYLVQSLQLERVPSSFVGETSQAR